MAFQRKLFMLLARPRDGGGGLSETDTDFVIDLIERQDEIDAALKEAEKERAKENGGKGPAGGGKAPVGTTTKKNPCAHLRARISKALRDGDFALAAAVSKTYMDCLAQKRVPPK